MKESVVSCACMPTIREEVDEIRAGDIVAVVGLNNTGTGDTLSAQNAPILLESMHFPEPVISVAIEPKTKADEEKLSEALARLGDGRSYLPAIYRC